MTLSDEGSGMKRDSEVLLDAARARQRSISRTGGGAGRDERAHVAAVRAPRQAAQCVRDALDDLECVKRAKTDRRFGGSRTAKTVETVQRFRLMAYTHFGPPNSDFGSIRTGGVR